MFTEIFGDGTIDIVASNFARTYNFLKDDPFIGVMHYLKLISYDFDYLWILGILGFFSSFFVIKDKKALFVIHSVLFSNLIMLCFLLFMLQQRYFFQVYSFYLIYPAIGIYTVYLIFLKFVRDKKYLKYREIIFGLIIVLILFVSIPFTFFENMFTLKMYKNIYINDKMAEYTFYPYKEACKYVKENIKPDEELVCTMPRIAEFYIDRDVRQLRQTRVKFNVADELVEDTTIYENSLQNHPSFINFLQTHKSGWIISDPRINTAVSAYTKNFIRAKMDHHILGSQPIHLMRTSHWDSTTVFKQSQIFALFCKQRVTANLPVDIVKGLDSNANVEIVYIYSGVEKPDEALCIVGNVKGYLPPNKDPGKKDTITDYDKSNRIDENQ